MSWSLPRRKRELWHPWSSRLHPVVGITFAELIMMVGWVFAEFDMVIVHYCGWSGFQISIDVVFWIIVQAMCMANAKTVGCPRHHQVGMCTSSSFIGKFNRLYRLHGTESRAAKPTPADKSSWGCEVSSRRRRSWFVFVLVRRGKRWMSGP